MGREGLVVAAGVLAAMTVMSGVVAAVQRFFLTACDALLFMQRVDKLPGEDGKVYCRYWMSAAMPMGIAAAALALTTQVLASVGIGCCGVWRNVPGQTRRIVVILLFVGSWVLAIKVVLLFMLGSMLGFSSYASRIVQNGSCTTGLGIFVAAMILFFIVVSLDIALYTLVQKGALDSTKAVGLEKPPPRIATGALGTAKC